MENSSEKILELLKKYATKNNLVVPKINCKEDAISFFRSIDRHYILKEYFENCKDNDFNREMKKKFMNNDLSISDILQLPIPENAFKSVSQIKSLFREFPNC